MLLHRSLSQESDNSANKRLRLKQRTTSIDNVTDITFQTWWSLRDLIKAREYWITVDHSSLWKRHVCWALTDGADLRGYLTSRFASSMVFMSLLMGAELSVLFNSAGITTDIRESLKSEEVFTLKFWIGIGLVVSIIFSLFSLIATYTAWGMVSAVSNENAHCVLRSSIGLYVTELPSRFIVASIYSFLVWFLLFICMLLPFGFWSVMLVVSVVFVFVHVMIVYSAFGRLIMHTGAMGKDRVFEEKFERNLFPRSLQANLYTKAKAELANNTSVSRQYRRELRPLSQEMTVEEMSKVLIKKTAVGHDTTSAVMNHGKPRESVVRFADSLLTTSDIRAHNADKIDPNGMQFSRLGPPLGKVEESNNSVISLNFEDEENQSASRSSLPLLPHPLSNLTLDSADDVSFEVGTSPTSRLRRDSSENFRLEYQKLFGETPEQCTLPLEMVDQAHEEEHLLTNNSAQGRTINYGASGNA